MTAEPASAAIAPAPADGDRPRPAPIGRRTALVAFVVGAVLNFAEAILGRLLGGMDSVAAGMAAWEEQPALAATGGIAGTIAVPFLLLSLVGMAQIVRPHMPKLGAVTTALAFAGGLGFFGMHAVMIVQYVAVDQPDRAAMVSLMEALQTSPMALLVLLPFMIGIPGAVLLASIGLLRTRAVPVWIPVVLLAFLVLDFGPFATGPVDPHWLFLAGSLGLAVTVARWTDRQWWTGSRNRDHAGSTP